MTTPKLLQEIAAEVILKAEVMPSSNACLALITDFVPYRWNAADNIHTKDARIRKLGNLSVIIVRDHMLHLMKCVLNTKSRHLGSMW